MSTINLNSGYGIYNMISIITGVNTGGWTYGKVLVVLKSTDTDNYDRITQLMRNDEEGVVRVFSTVTDALAVAQDNDKILVGPGVWTEADELVITQAGLKMIGFNTSGIEWGPCSLKATANHIISVQNNGVEIANLGFIQNGAYRGVEIDHTAAVYKTHIHDCHIGGSATATYGVYAGGTFDAVDTVIENCEFLSWSTAAIYMNATRSKARKNLIFGVDSSIGIELVPGTADRPYSLIDENIIIGTGTTDTGIKITNTPDKGTYMISRNLVGGCATTITQKPNNAYCSVNNYAADGAGGALIDTVA
jgi:hypothetical protein